MFTNKAYIATKLYLQRVVSILRLLCCQPPTMRNNSPYYIPNNSGSFSRLHCIWLAKLYKCLLILLLVLCFLKAGLRLFLSKICDTSLEIFHSMAFFIKWNHLYILGMLNQVKICLYWQTHSNAIHMYLEISMAYMCMKWTI